VDLGDLLARLPDASVRRATAHSSWARPRSESYERLAFLGDTVLDYIVTSHLDETFDPSDFGPGVLTRIRARVVSDDSLRAAASRVGLDAAAVRLAPNDFREQAKVLVSGGKPLASMLEGIIAVCWREIGPEETAVAVLATLAPELAAAVAEPVDAKSLLQEHLARNGLTVKYEGLPPQGPAHEPLFEVSAVTVPDGTVLGTGSGGSKKAAETAAAAEALAALEVEQ